MVYIMLSNLRVVLLFVCPIVERFKKIFMHYFIINSIIVYYNIIFLNTLNKVANYMELRIVKS